MSKEVILKYLTEFNAWVKEQEVYVMFNNGGHRLVDSLEDFNEDVKYIVLKDSYFFYRKELAEGRKIQFFNTKERLYDSSKPLHTWQDTETICTHGIPSDYRIKPEEPEFKVGDWVTHIEAEKPWQITDNSLKNLDNRNLRKWEPKKGEVCIFWDSVNTGAAISKFSHMAQKKYVTDLYTWSNCMPFTGVLPPHMKD